MKAISQPASVRSRSFLALAMATTLGSVMLVTSATSWAALSAQLERSTVLAGSSVILSIASDGAQSGLRPDVTPLRKDFDVLGTSTSSETSFVNGSRSDRTRWLIRLQPRHAGTIDVPSIAVGSERTAALVLTVTEPSSQTANAASTHVFLEAEAAATSAPIYIQQQIPYTVRLYYDDTVQQGELAAPDPANAIVEQLGEDKRYSATRNGREYNVLERRYAIAPEKSGALHIPSASFSGTALVAETGRGDAEPTDDMMERFLRNTPFANDPLFKGLGTRSAFGDPGQPIAVRSREITLDVQPRPAAAQGNWLPAEQVTMHDSWENSPPQFRVGEPVTRTITIDTKGLAASQIPALSLVPPANARLYPEASDNQSRTDGTAIYGTSKQSVTYIPTAQGKLTIPAVQLPWWNTRNNAPGLAALAAFDFNVEPGLGGARANVSPPVPAGAALPTTPPGTPAVEQLRQVSSLTDRLANHWPWMAGGAALLAMLGLLPVAVRRVRHARSIPGPGDVPTVSVPRKKDTLQALQRACVANDRHAAANAVLDLARVQWVDDPPRGLRALAGRLAIGAAEIVDLDRSLYGVDGSRWDGGALWNVLRPGLQPKRSESLHEPDGLRGLYPEGTAQGAA